MNPRFRLVAAFRINEVIGADSPTGRVLLLMPRSGAVRDAFSKDFTWEHLYTDLGEAMTDYRILWEMVLPERCALMSLTLKLADEESRHHGDSGTHYRQPD